MKTFKTILLMMLLATVTLSSCDNDDSDLTGKLIINTSGDYYSGGSFNIYTEEAALTDKSSSTEFYPSPVREGYLYEETIVEDLNHGTYYIECYAQDSYYGRTLSFQISGGKTTKIFAGSKGIELID